MAVNWVMRSEEGGFTPLPGEQRIYSSPPRTAFQLQSLNKASNRDAYSLSSGAGVVHLTNRRVVYLPAQSSPTLQSFTAPILHIRDSRVTAPFFGPNVWTALVQPVAGGGVPPAHAAVELKLTFKDGGAFDFHTAFERIKERLAHAVEVARESGRVTGDGSESGAGRGGGALAGVGLQNVHLDELPAYEPRASASTAVSVPGAPTAPDRDRGVGHSPAPAQKEASASGSARQPPISPAETDPVFTPPNEPPPGYEEVQMDSVARELELALRETGDRQDDDGRER